MFGSYQTKFVLIKIRESRAITRTQPRQSLIPRLGGWGHERRTGQRLEGHIGSCILYKISAVHAIIVSCTVVSKRHCLLLILDAVTSSTRT